MRGLEAGGGLRAKGAGICSLDTAGSLLEMGRECKTRELCTRGARLGSAIRAGEANRRRERNALPAVPYQRSLGPRPAPRLAQPSPASSHRMENKYGELNLCSILDPDTVDPHEQDQARRRLSENLNTNSLRYGTPWLGSDQRWTVHDGKFFAEHVIRQSAHDRGEREILQLVVEMDKLVSAPNIANIGRGSSGKVYLSRARRSPKRTRKEDGRMVVRKIIDISAIEKHTAAQVEYEIKILRKLHHPNIVPYICSRRVGHSIEIYMEYARGGCLGRIISKRRKAGEPFKTEQVCKWISQLALAVVHLHARNILHRDIKSINIFLTDRVDDSQGRCPDIKVGDFGLATFCLNTGKFENEQMESTLCGTPYYFAPELLSGCPHSTMTDTWAVGVVLFELLTLTFPFNGKDFSSLKQKIVSGAYDETSLTKSPHPAWLRNLANHRTLLQKLPVIRMPLKVVKDILLSRQSNVEAGNVKAGTASSHGKSGRFDDPEGTREREIIVSNTANPKRRDSLPAVLGLQVNGIRHDYLPHKSGDDDDLEETREKEKSFLIAANCTRRDSLPAVLDPGMNGKSHDPYPVSCANSKRRDSLPAVLDLETNREHHGSYPVKIDSVDDDIFAGCNTKGSSPISIYPQSQKYLSRLDAHFTEHVEECDHIRNDLHSSSHTLSDSSNLERNLASSRASDTSQSPMFEMSGFT